jgi:hypothetical protein
MDNSLKMSYLSDMEIRPIRRHRIALYGIFVFGLFLQQAHGDMPLSSFPSTVDIDTSVVRDIRNGDSFTFKIHPKLPPYTFKLIADHQLDAIKTIEIYVSGMNHPSQVLAVGDMEAPYRHSTYFKSVDIDFDGYQDIALLSWWGATGNEGWTFWRFNPITKTFVQAPEISALGRPEFDAQTRTIHSHSKGGWCEYTVTDYDYKEGELHMIGGKTCKQPIGKEPGSECDCSPFVERADYSIKNAFLDNSKNVHVIYADKNDVKVTTEGSMSDVKVAPDEMAAGWVVNFKDDNNGSYQRSYPLAFEILQKGQVKRIRDDIDTIWDWSFLKDANHIAVCSGPTHGWCAYQFYDLAVSTKAIGMCGAPNSADRDVPRWAKEFCVSLKKK